jgi:hypothetical protein
MIGFNIAPLKKYFCKVKKKERRMSHTPNMYVLSYEADRTYAHTMACYKVFCLAKAYFFLFFPFSNFTSLFPFSGFSGLLQLVQ